MVPEYERVIIFRHALRNALIPFLSILGLEAGFLLGGSGIVEQIFSWPGIGWLMLNTFFVDRLWTLCDVGSLLVILSV